MCVEKYLGSDYKSVAGTRDNTTNDFMTFLRPTQPLVTMGLGGLIDGDWKRLDRRRDPGGPVGY